MTASILLQTIGESGPFDGDAITWLLDLLVRSFGGPALFGVLMSAVIFVVFYVASDGDVATPTVALILIGTVTVPMVPQNYGRIGAAIVLMGLAGAVYLVLKRAGQTR